MAFNALELAAHNVGNHVIIIEELVTFTKSRCIGLLMKSGYEDLGREKFTDAALTLTGWMDAKLRLRMKPSMLRNLNLRQKIAITELLSRHSIFREVFILRGEHLDFADTLSETDLREINNYIVANLRIPAFGGPNAKGIWRRAIRVFGRLASKALGKA